MDMINQERNALGGCWVRNDELGEQCKIDELTCFLSARTDRSNAFTQEVKSCGKTLTPFNGKEEMTPDDFNYCKISPGLVVNNQDTLDEEDNCDPNSCIPGLDSTMDIFQNSTDPDAGMMTIKIENNEKLSNCITQSSRVKGTDSDILLNNTDYTILNYEGDEKPAQESLTKSELDVCGARMYKYGPPNEEVIAGDFLGGLTEKITNPSSSDCEGKGKYCQFPSYNAPVEAFCSSACSCEVMQCAEGQRIVCYVPSVANVLRSMWPNPLNIFSDLPGLGSIFQWILYIGLFIGIIMILMFLNNFFRSGGF